MEGKRYLKRGEVPKVQLLTEDVYVSRWDATVIVSELTGQEMDAYQQSLFDFKGTEIINKRDNHQAKLVRWAVKDETGEYIFNSLDEITSLPSMIISDLFNVASKLNAMTKEETTALEKN